MSDDIKLRVSKFVDERIMSPESQKIMAALEHCRSFSKYGGEPKCMLLTGPSGVGKTSIIEKYLKQNPRRNEYEVTEIPVLHVTLSEIKTTVSMYQQILYNLGHPRPFESKNELELRVQIKSLVKNCKVEMIIIDEFQQLIERKTNAILSDTANSLKRLIIEIKIPVVLVGMPYSVVILDTNSQLSSRFQHRHNIQPFRISKEQDRISYYTFLSLLEKQMFLPEESNLSKQDIASRLYMYCEGSCRKLRGLLDVVFEQTLISGEGKISLARLASTASFLDPELDKATNPFLIDSSEIKIKEPDEKVGWEDYHDGKPRLKRQKKRDMLKSLYS